tara:strand:+ start:5957 stop:6532 length:576 start_codon:yes stop_codon:yes gene_type:complete
VPSLPERPRGVCLSGLADTLDDRAKVISHARQMQVPTLTARHLLETYYASETTIDYVSLDVEGHELEVMRAWPFDARWCVSVFTIENNHWCNASRGILPELQLILGRQYAHHRSIGPDEVFVRRQRCKRDAVSARDHRPSRKYCDQPAFLSHRRAPDPFSELSCVACVACVACMACMACVLGAVSFHSLGD